MINTLAYYGLKFDLKIHMSGTLHNKQINIEPKQWNRAFLNFSLIIEGTTEKVSQFKTPLKSIYKTYFVSILIVTNDLAYWGPFLS